MSDDNDRLYNPDGWGCGGTAAGLVVAVMALLLVVIV